MQTTKTITAALMAGAAIIALSGSASAAKKASDATSAAPANTATDERIKALEEQIQTLSDQVVDLKRSTGDQYTDIRAQQDEQVKVTIANGRPTITSADGAFSAAIRTLVQFDWAYYSQGAGAKTLPAAYGPDLSSGANFRRVYLGLQGKLFGDWSYNLNFDFGGSGGTENPGRIQSVYLEYDGLAPWAIRVGAFPPPANLEDGTGSGETIFLERNSPSNLQRGLAGGDGRDAISLLYTGERVFGALSYTGAKVQDSAVFDEQQAALGRLSYLVVSAPEYHFLVGVNGTHIFKLPDAVANGSPTLGNTPGATALNSLTLADPPELTVDSNGIKLANTGALPANHLTQWGLEAAGNYGPFYAQTGYYSFGIDRAAVAYKTFTSATTSATTIFQPSNNTFSGWYVQAAWTITGEPRSYNAANGAFSQPKPKVSVGHGGWGALELAARYSDLNLNSHTLDTTSLVTAWTAPGTQTYTFPNTVRGGDQRIATVGLNWYVSTAIRFALDYQWIDVKRLQAPSAVTVTSGTPALPAVWGGQNLQTLAFRAQFAL
ncbi:porin [Rhizomicrobium electricum]|jgi:phosphate-selective porin OprO/OprP|uniref:OprO/OprP family phosphate-selective porin n=1 Tax=Rhizomicrobium electricum TaxID=480070 RepID=A0ABN1E6P6_9PROT|nr:porin [Rhizomicrobium electricum]NIJ47803.1 phosphate-selective porin OprO/OprP [Rhizomicrobium electricum]